MATIPKKLTLELNLPDEVLIEILLRLPLLSLQLFRSVSKHWFSLITSKYFTRRLRKPRIEPPCGLFIRKKESELYYDFVSLGPKVTSFPLRTTITEAGSYFKILKSCNGLHLCSNYVSRVHYYYVYNPFTNIFKNIPFALEPYSVYMILAFDPTKSPYYKVVVIKRVNYHTEQIRAEIYSSKTGKWSICGPPFPEDRFAGVWKGIYWNNAIHWINDYDRLHSKLDIVDNNPMVTNIQTPAIDDSTNTSFFDSRGTLLLLVRDYDICYHVFEMREESSEWLVKYIVDDIVKILPDLYLRWHSVHCIVLGEKGDDSFMVIESGNKIVRYNFVSRTVSTLCNITPYTCWSNIPFIASLAGV